MLADIWFASLMAVNDLVEYRWFVFVCRASDSRPQVG